MKFGDLSNKVAPRAVILFEGLLGILPADSIQEHDRAKKKNDWVKVVSLYKMNEPYLQKLLFLTWKKDINFSVVTWMPEPADQAVIDRMDVEGIPVRGCFSSSPESLARMLPYNPDVALVYVPSTEYVLTLGSKCYVVTDPSDIGKTF
jgi:hypothetical protein